MRPTSFKAGIAVLALAVMLVACAPAPLPEAAQPIAGSTPAEPIEPPPAVAPHPAAVEAAANPPMSDEEWERMRKGMVAGKSYHIDLRFRDKLHLWRVRFDGQQVIGTDGNPTLLFGMEGPAVIGEAGSGPLTVYPRYESGWRWKQEDATVELWKDEMRYRGTLKENTIEGDYVEGGEEGTFVMTLAE